MQFFIETPDYIRIIDETKTPNEVTCTRAQFLSLEPLYADLPDGMAGRWWSAARNYAFDAAGNSISETFDGSVYAANVATYAVTLGTPEADSVSGMIAAFDNAPVGNDWAACDGGVCPAGWELHQQLIDRGYPYGGSGSAPLLPDGSARILFQSP